MRDHTPSLPCNPNRRRASSRRGSPGCQRPGSPPAHSRQFGRRNCAVRFRYSRPKRRSPRSPQRRARPERLPRRSRIFCCPYHCPIVVRNPGPKGCFVKAYPNLGRKEQACRCGKMTIRSGHCYSVPGAQAADDRSPSTTGPPHAILENYGALLGDRGPPGLSARTWCGLCSRKASRSAASTTLPPANPRTWPDWNRRSTFASPTSSISMPCARPWRAWITCCIRRPWARCLVPSPIRRAAIESTSKAR